MMNIESIMVLFAVVAALGLVGVVVVDIMLTAQEAEARGCPSGVAFNESRGRCLH
jgi:hypothetical protein